MAKSERSPKLTRSAGTACMEGMSMMDSRQFSSDDDDDDTTLSGRTPLLLDVENAESKASKIRRVNLMNLLMMSAIFLLQNAAFSIYYDDVIFIWKSSGLEQWWFISKCCFFGCYLFSCVVGPFICEHLLNIKQCLLLGSLSISGIVTAQLIPHSYTLITAAVLAGLLLPLYFISQGSCLTNSSHRYACPLGVNLVKQTPESAITLFHALFHCLYISGPIWRNLLNLVILNDDYLAVDAVTGYGFEKCSLQLQYNHTTFDSYRIFRMEALLGSFLTLSLAAVLIVVFCFTSPNLNPDNPSKDKRRSVLKTFFPAAVADYILWMALSLALGVQQYFIYNIFPQALISSCYHEVNYILFIVSVAGASSVFALLQGLITNCIGRCKLVLISGTVSLSLCIAVLVVKTDRLSLEVVYILGCLWAAMDGVWQTQLSALISIRYYEVKEVSFSNHRFWQMTGILISYFLSKYACSKYVIFVSITTITMGTVVYLESEIRLRLKEQEMRHVQESHYKLQDVDGSTWIPTLNPWKQRQRSELVTLPQSKEWQQKNLTLHSR